MYNEVVTNTIACSTAWLGATNQQQIADAGAHRYHAAGAYHYATWSGISGDRFHSRFTGADFSIVDNPWLDEHIRKNHGPLGAEYPVTKFLMEGDTPSFLWLINNGRDPKMVPGTAARMDWTVKRYKDANHPPKAVLDHSNMLQPKSGETLRLSAEGSADPDGDKLSYEWMYYAEPGTYSKKEPIAITGRTATKATLVAPVVEKPEIIHIILKVTDSGKPALTRYQRVILVILPS